MKKSEWLQLSISFAVVLMIGVLLTSLAINWISQREETVAAVEIAPPLYDMEPLKEQLDTLLADKSGEWSFYVKALENGAVLEYDNQQMQPASVIKLFRMVGFYKALSENLIQATPEILDKVNRMIIYSENFASNEVVEYIGNGDFEKGAEYVTNTAKALGCTKTSDGMRLFDFDPGYLVPGINYSCVTDCGVVLEKIYKKECISPEYDQEMMELLLRQTRREKIPAKLPEGIKIANKTGETDDIQADVGIVFSEEDYVICAMVNQTINSYQSHQTIADASRIVYDFFDGIQK